MSIQKHFIASALLCLLVSPMTVIYAQPISSKDFSVLERQIQRDGVVSVIVEYADLKKESRPQLNTTIENKINLVKSMRQQLVSSMSTKAIQSIRHDYQYVPASVLNVDQVTLNELSRNPNIKNIYQNKQRKAHLAESVDIVYANHKSSKFTGGGEWVVAVLDTGVDKNHNFLKTGATKKVISEACYSGGGYSPSVYKEIDRLCPGNTSKTTANGTGVPCSGYSGSCHHGTHVAGIAAGDGNTSDGVASGGKVLAVQIFTGLRDVFNRNICGTGVGENCIVTFDSDILKGLERVYALRSSLKIAAVNMSLGGGQFFQVVRMKIH